ncbi:hypothetical protein C5167_044498 [Papaver somniferum]|uniref:Knottin scorpion toxin-like domain-containing protein n=1 Tax=Papaver somniferum TaxID=3469 RepID=A0A4Y7LB86_PAPSO|nr:hypothetical protein C5167_044498 [Papaver somniferum]
MASGKVTAIAFLVMFIVLCSDISRVMVTNAQKYKCCEQFPMPSCRTGDAAANARCSSMCSDSCFKDGSNGLCKLWGNKHYCHCRC